MEALLDQARTLCKSPEQDEANPVLDKILKQARRAVSIDDEVPETAPSKPQRVEDAGDAGEDFLRSVNDFHVDQNPASSLCGGQKTSASCGKHVAGCRGEAYHKIALKLDASCERTRLH